MRKRHTKNRAPVSRKLKRRSYYVDPAALTKARRLLGVVTDSEAVRIAIDRTAETEEFWRFMDKSRGTLKPGDIELP